jgi:hypothetical protein
MVPVQMEFSEEARRRIEELQKEVLETSGTNQLREALQLFWLAELETADIPLLIITDKRVVKNEAAVKAEEEARSLSAAVQASQHEELLKLKDTQIRILTEKVVELEELPITTQEKVEVVKEASLLLAMWRAFSAKPGLFGFSVDLKGLAEDTWAFTKENNKIIELGLNKHPKRK